MIGQPVVRSAEIIALVFDAGAKVPFAGDQKTMVVTKIIIERIDMPEFGFLKVAPERVGCLVTEKVARGFLLWCG